MSKIKTIFRVNKERNFTQIHNTALHDKRLNLKAKGLLALMLSFPDDWDFSREHMLNMSSDGKDGLNSALKLLCKFGYSTVSSVRDEKGKIQKWIITVNEIPGGVAAEGVHPETGFPEVAYPDLANPPYTNTKRTSNTKTTTTRAVVGNEKLYELASKARVGISCINILLARYDSTRIEKHLNVMIGSTSINKPEAWLSKAVSNDYDYENTATITHDSIDSCVWTEAQYSSDLEALEKISDKSDWRDKLRTEYVNVSIKNLKKGEG